jgi:hypothetical protein
MDFKMVCRRIGELYTLGKPLNRGDVKSSASDSPQIGKTASSSDEEK